MTLVIDVLELNDADTNYRLKPKRCSMRHFHAGIAALGLLLGGRSETDPLGAVTSRPRESPCLALERR